MAKMLSLSNFFKKSKKEKSNKNEKFFKILENEHFLTKLENKTLIVGNKKFKTSINYKTQALDYENFKKAVLQNCKNIEEYVEKKLKEIFEKYNKVKDIIIKRIDESNLDKKKLRANLILTLAEANGDKDKKIENIKLVYKTLLEYYNKKTTINDIIKFEYFIFNGKKNLEKFISNSFTEKSNSLYLIYWAFNLNNFLILLLNDIETLESKEHIEKVAKRLKNDVLKEFNISENEIEKVLYRIIKSKSKENDDNNSENVQSFTEKRNLIGKTKE